MDYCVTGGGFRDALVQYLEKDLGGQVSNDYLEAFAKLKVVRSASFDRNSAANQFRSAVGLNQQGSETIRVSMYGNRYNFDNALKLFGAKSGYGAQKP